MTAGAVGCHFLLVTQGVHSSVHLHSHTCKSPRPSALFQTAKLCSLKSPKMLIPPSAGTQFSRNTKAWVHRGKMIYWTAKHCNRLSMPCGMLLKEFWNNCETFWMLKHWMSQKNHLCPTEKHFRKQSNWLLATWCNLGFSSPYCKCISGCLLLKLYPLIMCLYIYLEICQTRSAYP